MSRNLAKAIVTLTFAVTVGYVTPEADAAFDVNLLTNPGAESGTFVATVGGFSIYSTPGWTSVSGAFEAELYSEGVPPNITPTSPGPADRGSLHFYGGNAALTIATQVINVSGDASTIDAGKALANVSGWLGGFADQGDTAILSATFLGAGGNALNSVSIGPVLASDRGNVSGLLFRSANALLPTGTRSIEATLTITRGAGAFNNGAADNLNITLAVVPEPSSLILCGIPTASGLAYALRRRKASR
jgi:hypothetical protein